MRVNYRRTTYILASALVAGALLTGCSAGASDNKSASAGAADNAVAPQRAEGGAAQAEQQPATGKDQPAQQSPDLAVDQRSIIYRGGITVRAKDSVNAAADQATSIATTAGGFIGADNRTTGEGGADTATMTLRVPADKFSAVVNQLARLGTEEHREINTEDVTEQTVDLDARIQVQQARVDSGRRLLAQAKTLNDLVMLEKEVATRESDLASLQAKKRNLADLTALSTITVTFLGPAAPAPKPKEENPGGFLGGLTAGWHALLASLKVVLTVLGALLPWAIVIGLPAWLAFYLYRRYNRPKMTPALVPTGPAAPPAVPEKGTDEN